MTDYASATESPWTWWTNAAAATAAAIRMQNVSDHQHSGGGADTGTSDHDDEFSGPYRKRQRLGVGYGEYWLATLNQHDDSGGNDDSTMPTGPLDLSVKATLTTTTTTTKAAHKNHRGRDKSVVGTSDGCTTATTPSKKSTSTTVVGATKSLKKTDRKTVNGTSAAAVKAATRKLLPQLLQLDQHRHIDRSSPVSGTIIVAAGPEMKGPTGRVSSSPSSPPLSPYTTSTTDCGNGDEDYDGEDIDPEFNVVVATEEARRRLESIPNALGPYRCRLCSVQYADAFALARHRCRCIVHVRYRCPECDKVFQCPANLASHRRWHGTFSAGANSNNRNNNTKNSENKNGIKPEMATQQHCDNATASPTACSNKDDDDDDDDNSGGTTTACIAATAVASSAVTASATAGFKKNILQRAVQAAAANNHVA